VPLTRQNTRSDSGELKVTDVANGESVISGIWGFFLVDGWKFKNNDSPNKGGSTYSQHK
jgi:hypothetical protein